MLQEEKGQNLVELALTMMLLLLLMAGAVDMGRAFHNYIIITNSAREGARLGARLPCKSDNRAALKSAIQNAAIAEAANSGVTIASSNITIVPDPVNTGCAAARAVIRVSVNNSFTPIMTGVLGFGTFTMQNYTEMMSFGSDQ